MAPYGLIWDVSMVRENRFQVDCQLSILHLQAAERPAVIENDLRRYQ